MQYPQIDLTVAGSFWRLGNPYLPVTAPVDHTRARTPLYATLAAAASGTVTGATAMLAAASGPVALTVAAIGATGAAGGVFTWLDRRNTHTARILEQNQESLYGTLGSRYLTRSDFRDPELRRECDRAVASTATIVGSAAFGQGLLGDPDTVGHDVQTALWDLVHAFADLDERTGNYRQAESAIAAHCRSNDQQIAATVRSDLAADAAPLFAQAATLEELAGQARLLDARLAGPQIDEALALSLRPTRHRTEMAGIDRVASTLAAASEVLDADGLH